MERIIDFLAEEERLAEQEPTRNRKAGKKERIRKLLKVAQPEPVVDFLAMGD